MITLNLSTDIVALAAFVVSLFNVIFTLVITRRRDRTSIRPVLVFTYRSDGWYLQNVGNGPALDVVFCRILRGDPTDQIRMPALAKDESLCLHFARHSAKQIFVATYRDINEKKYSTRSQHDQSVTCRGFITRRPENIEALKRWWVLPSRDDFE